MAGHRPATADAPVIYAFIRDLTRGSTKLLHGGGRRDGHRRHAVRLSRAPSTSPRAMGEPILRPVVLQSVDLHRPARRLSRGPVLRPQACAEDLGADERWLGSPSAAWMKNCSSNGPCSTGIRRRSPSMTLGSAAKTEWITPSSRVRRWRSSPPAEPIPAGRPCAGRGTARPASSPRPPPLCRRTRPRRYPGPGSAPGAALEFAELVRRPMNKVETAATTHGVEKSRPVAPKSWRTWTR